MPDSNKTILQGRTLLVTRPEHQADDLCNRLVNLGASIVRFPLIEIQFFQQDPLLTMDKRLEYYQHLIFISRNAVHAAVHIWPDLSKRLQNKTIYAIGAATHDTLSALGFIDIVHCTGPASSEILLKKPELSQQRIHAQSILILRGQGGREHLANILTERGAKVAHADLYKRRRPCYDQARLDKIETLAVENVIVIITSIEALDNLIAILQPGHTKSLFKLQLLVISQRIANHADQLGFVKEAFVANNTSDDGLISTLIKSLNEEN